MSWAAQWFKSNNWEPQPFQKQCWKAYKEGKSGILHAPTGSGKTYALWGGIINELKANEVPPKGLTALWITDRKSVV